MGSTCDWGKAVKNTRPEDEMDQGGRGATEWTPNTGRWKNSFKRNVQLDELDDSERKDSKERGTVQEEVQNGR